MNFNFVPITAASCLTSITISFLLSMISSAKKDEDIIEYDNIIKKISFNILGCIISPFLSERLGRKRAIMIIDVLFLFSLICSVFKYEEFARWLLSLAIGISKPATPLFISEKTRQNFTYCCIFLYNICIPTGVFINYIITLYLNKTAAYAFGFSCIILHFLIVYNMGETLPYLLKKGRMAEAREEATNYYTEEHVDGEIMKMLRELSGQSPEANVPFSNSLVRRSLLLCILAHIVSRTVGASYVSRQKSKIIDSVGFSRAFEYSSTIITACMGLAFSIFLAERIRRKILLFYSLSILTLNLFALDVTNFLASFLKIDLNGAKVLPVEIYTLVYPATLGSLPWVLVTEIFPHRHKSYSLAICSCFNFVTNTLVIISLSGASEARSYLVFGLFSFLGQYTLDYFFNKFEEEKLRSMEEVSRGESV